MNEEIEYAEMLEIPVSTVNVVKKKNRRVRGKNAPNLKERLISRVNNRVGDPDYSRAAPADALAQDPLYAAAENAALEDAAQNSPLPESEVNAYAYSDGGERMDTVLLSDEPAEKGWRKKKKLRFSEEDAAFEGELSENEPGRYAMKTPSERRSGVFLTVEFALACALCGTIFLTNVFVPQSAINTFFRSLMPAAAERRIPASIPTSR